MDYKEIEREENRLASTYNITNVHAGCFMCNFENEYICIKYNGGCKGLNKCREIFEKEKKQLMVNGMSDLFYGQVDGTRMETLQVVTHYTNQIMSMIVMYI